MMKNRLLILSAAVVAAGLFVLPQAVSMFAGQHSWYDPKDQGIPCEKCHWLEHEEMTGVERTDHVPLGVSRGVEWAFDCEECHSVTMNISSYHHEGDTGEHTPAHAATTLSCLDCHRGELYGMDENPSLGWYDIPMHDLAIGMVSSIPRIVADATEIPVVTWVIVNHSSNTSMTNSCTHAQHIDHSSLPCRVKTPSYPMQTKPVSAVIPAPA